MARNFRRSRGRSSKRKATQIENMADAIAQELSNYREEVTEKVKSATDEVMDTMVKNAKRDAPVGYRRGKYKRAISSRLVYENEYKKVKVWYVKPPEYRLAHLLNNGHRLKNGGFVKGDKHISRNAYLAVKEFEEKVKDAITNGY